jgi:hypothetical protein
MDTTEVEVKALARFILVPRLLISRFHEIDRNSPVDRTQYARLDDHHSVKHGSVTDCAAAFTVARICSKVLAPLEGCRQRLTLHGAHDHSAMAFLVKRPIEVIARVCIPISITARVHDKYLALAVALNPHRQPKIRIFPQGHRVLLFTRHPLKFHQSNLRAALTTRHRFVERASNFLAPLGSPSRERPDTSGTPQTSKDHRR